MAWRVSQVHKSTQKSPRQAQLNVPCGAGALSKHRAWRQRHLALAWRHHCTRPAHGLYTGRRLHKGIKPALSSDAVRLGECFDMLRCCRHSPPKDIHPLISSWLTTALVSALTKKQGGGLLAQERPCCRQPAPGHSTEYTELHKAAAHAHIFGRRWDKDSDTNCVVP